MDLLQVQRCLLRGTITEGPYIPTSSKSGYWRCNVEATVGGDELRVVVELPDDPPEVLVITVIRIG